MKKNRHVDARGLAAMSYAAAMAADRERLEKARKRNQDAAALHGEDADDVESAWDSVFQMGAKKADDGEEEQRKRKAQRKAEKRKEKLSAEAANAGSLTVYVSGIPSDIGWTAVQNLFAKAGEVRRVKLYKDAAGEQKGDGLVTFAKEAAVQAALARDDWALFGESLTVTPVRPTPPRARGRWPHALCGEPMSERRSLTHPRARGAHRRASARSPRARPRPTGRGSSCSRTCSRLRRSAKRPTPRCAHGRPWRGEAAVRGVWGGEAVDAAG